jgi:subfamily B ATP-binding cassette protein MsbA
MNDAFKEISSRQWVNDCHTIWALTKKHLPVLVVAVMCGLALSAINGGIAWLVKPAMETVSESKDKTMLFLLPVGVFVLFVFRGLFTFSNNFLMNAISAKIIRSLRLDLYEKLLRLPVSFYLDKTSGGVISRLLNDINSLERSIASLTKDFFLQSMTVIVLLAVAFFRKWDLALLSLTVMPIVVAATSELGKRMKRVSRKRRKLISLITKLIHETLAGIRIIKAFTMEKAMNRRTERAVAEHYRNVLREVRVDEFTGFLMEIIAGLGIAIILWYGIYLIYYDKMTVAVFTSYLVAVFMLFPPLKKLSRINNKFQKTRTGLHRIKEIYAIDDEEEGGTDVDHVSGHVRLERVSFGYPASGGPVLTDVDLDISPGETVAVVGHSGAGKSTLADLVLGFWDSYSGTISMDGMDIKQYTSRSLRSHIGVVSQDVVLFGDTVRNNILFGRPDASEEEVVEAAHASYAHEFITEMPDGYDTHIGERGAKLSGGQKQRISLARALLKNPRILILDEATSSLDADSEAKIQKALEAIMPNRTTIIIAHRLSTVKNAGRIVVMDRGRIIQDGTHIELYSRSGVYQELYNTQMNVAGE